MLHHVQGYLKRSGDPVTAGVSDPLVFPSVAQSIIEIQDLSVPEILVYFHPWAPVAVLGMLGFLLVLWARSGALFLLPLAALAFLSTKMGGRLVMFGAPVIALGLTLPVDWLACTLGDIRAKWTRRIFLSLCIVVTTALIVLPRYGEQVLAFWTGLGDMRYAVAGCAAVMLFIGTGRRLGWRITRLPDSIGPHFIYRLAAVFLLLVVIIPPLADLVPAMTHGPILNRRHADALRTLRTATPENAMICTGGTGVTRLITLRDGTPSPTVQPTAAPHCICLQRSTPRPIPVSRGSSSNIRRPAGTFPATSSRT